MLRFLLSVGVLLSLLFPLQARAEEFALAKLGEKRVRELLTELLPAAQVLRESTKPSALLLQRAQVFDVHWRTHERWDNSILWILDEQAARHAAQHVELPSGTKLESAHALRIQAGIDGGLLSQAVIQSIDEDQIRIAKTQWGPQVRIDFGTVSPGDILVWSIRFSAPRTMESAFLAVMSEYPTLRLQLRLISEARMRFKTFGRGFDSGQVRKTVLKSTGGIVEDLLLEIDVIEGPSAEYRALPLWKATPRLVLVQTDRVGEWAEVGAYYNGMRSELESVSGSLPDFARQFQTDRTKPIEAVYSAYRLLRDEFAELPSSQTIEEGTTLERALQERAGTAATKSHLLRKVLQELGHEEVDVVWAHDARDGEFLEQFPNLSQLTTPLVRMIHGSRELWFDLACKTCPPGTLPPYLSDQAALWYEPKAPPEEPDEYTKKLLQSLSEMGVKVNYNLTWPKTKLLRTPEQNRDVENSLVESWSVSSSGEGARLELTLSQWGYDEFGEEVRSSRAPDTVLEAWIRSRYPWSGDVQFHSLSSAIGDSLQARASVGAVKLPEPDGDRWAIPADLIFGTALVPPSSARRSAPYWLDAAQLYLYEARIPLPQGWGQLELPVGHEISGDSMQYTLQFAVEGHELVIRRRVRFVAADIREPEALARLGELHAAVHQLETAPQHFRRAAGDPTP